MELPLLLFASVTALLLLSPAAVAAGVGITGGAASHGVWGHWWTQSQSKKPVDVGEDAEDLRLLRRAAREAAVAPPATAPPKVAFMFLTNSDLTFAPLWECFFAGHEARFTVYVHADPAAALRLPPTPSFRGRFIAARPTRRADPTLIAAARRLLAAALLDDPANAYFALLSQHCVPLHSFPRLYAALFPSPTTTTTPHAAARHRRWNRRLRLPSYIEVLGGVPRMPSRYVARGADALLPEVPFESFRMGSQFFALSRRHAALVARERRLWRRFRAPCLPEMAEHSCFPEEHYFPTLLDMADPAGVARYTLTSVNWTGSVGGHPHTYAAPEVTPRLVADLRASDHGHPHMFARKFAPDCLGPLMAIADTVIFKD